eukprot:TRINITY_DN74210_c0_g1_i1.p1 TRINITY_DN74210_c0_g1~~TRINITY_DN74210_c0_g1_i1.p1  ORF type:complete len:832 (-),score=104.80 TRINITY_DN74210_c0_g1_i1:268-2718(-)
MAALGQSLSAFLSMRGSYCLNEATNHPLINCLTDDEKELRSDADPQLLINLQFTEPMNLMQLRLAACGEEAPTTVKLFANRQNVAFSDVESLPVTQEVALNLESETEVVLDLSAVKFRNVHNVVIFIEDNGGADETAVRCLEVFGARVRGETSCNAPEPTKLKRQKAGNEIAAEVASRLAMQSSEEGISLCLVEVASVLGSVQGRDAVRKATEVFVASATDSGDQRRRALLMLGACGCPALCLESGRGEKAISAATKAAMRTAVQGLVGALQNVVEAERLRPLLRELIERQVLGRLRGADEAMHLFCRLMEPIKVPPCSRGKAGNADSDDSESEASEVENDDEFVSKNARAAKRVRRDVGGESTVDSAESRAARLHVLLEKHFEEAQVATAEHVAVAREEGCQKPTGALDEFMASMAFDVKAAEEWPLLFPGSGTDGLQFHADFEGANLRRARLQSDGGVEILLCGDTNRSSFSQWFFFDIEVAKPVDLRIRIVTYVKPGSTFSEGQRVVTRSGDSGWQRDGYDYAYVPNRYIIGERSRNYTLAFTLPLPRGRTRVAHFYPYLLGDLLADLRRLHPCGDWLSVQDIGPTPGRRPLLMLTITAFTEESQERIVPHIVFSARVHPGEVPASFMMRGVLELLLSDSAEAHDLRRRFKFVVMPMLNPDGVASGNGRVNLAGYDLNRCWEKPPEGTEIVASRRVIEECCSSSGGVFAYLDFHAHSRRHGVFTLSNPATQPWPNQMSQIADSMFDRKQCVFSYNKSKRGSARCVVWKDLGVEHSHTVEATYAAAPDKSRLVTMEDLAKVGHNMVRACARLYG